jgi:hypothetical protein
LKKEANKRNFMKNREIQRQHNTAMVADTDIEIVKIADDIKASAAKSLAIEKSRTNLAAAAELARSQARRDLRKSKCSANFNKTSTNNTLVPPPMILQITHPTEEVPQQDISPPLLGGGQPLDCPLTSPVLHPVQLNSQSTQSKAYPPPNPSIDYDTENYARENLKRKRCLDKDDDSSNNVDSTPSENE